MTPLLFIFDLDGTLIDSRADLALATNAMRALHQLPPLPLETVASFVGDGVRTLAIRALEGAPVDPDLAARQISAAYAENLIVHTTPYPDVDEGLRRLHRAGHSLALVTNKPGPHTRRIVAHFGWTELFSVILGGGDTEELKPSPLSPISAPSPPTFARHPPPNMGNDGVVQTQARRRESTAHTMAVR